MHRGLGSHFVGAVDARAFRHEHGQRDRLFYWSEHGDIECKRDIPLEYIEGIWYTGGTTEAKCVYHRDWR